MSRMSNMGVSPSKSLENGLLGADLLSVPRRY